MPRAVRQVAHQKEWSAGPGALPADGARQCSAKIDGAPHVRWRQFDHGWGLLLCVVAVVVLIGMVVDFVPRHPYWSAFLASLVVAVAVAVGCAVSKRRARERADQAQRDRLIVVTECDERARVRGVVRADPGRIRVHPDEGVRRYR